MKKIFNLKSFWSVLALAAIVFFLVFFDMNKNYQAQTQILVLPQNATMAINFPYIMKNLQFLAQDEKGSKIGLRALKDSGVLEITATGKNASAAEILSQKATGDLLNKAAPYYDIKKDLVFKMLGTKVITQNFSPLVFSVLESLIFAFSLSFLAFSFSFFFFKEETSDKKMVPGIFSWDKKVQRNAALLETKLWLPKEKSIEKVAKKEEEKISTNYDLCKTAAAPDNLPISSENKKGEEITLSLNKKTPLIREATPEEVKERLNKLLSGKLS